MTERAQFRILVDADACPVTELTRRIANGRGIGMILFCDTNHELSGDVRICSSGRDSADFVLAAACRRGDLVITQDYGLAAIVLGKGALAIHPDGRIYRPETIDLMLLERHLAKKARRAGKRLKGSKKRTAEDDARFEAGLLRLIEKAQAL